MQHKAAGNLILARLFPKESVLDCLEAAAREYKIATAVVLSGLGQLGQFSLGFFREKGNYLPESFSEPHELLSLTGILSQAEELCDFHLHAVLGNAEKKVVGGHFVSGIVSVTAEIVLLKVDLNVIRREETETGLKGLFLQ